MLVPARQVGTLARRAQSSKRNRLTVGYLAGWAAPNGGPLDAMDSAQAAAAIRPASLHPVLGSSLGTDLIFELGPNLKNLRLDARPCSAGRHARTAGPVLQKEPTDGGVSGGVGHSQWWPSGGHGFGSGSCGDSVHIDSQGPASLHPVLGSSLGTDIIFEFGPNLKNPASMLVPARQVGTLARRAQSSKRNRLTVGYLAGWATPNGGRQRQPNLHSRPACPQENVY